MEMTLHQAFFAGAMLSFALGVTLAIASVRYYARHEIRAVTDELCGRTRQRVLSEHGARLELAGASGTDRPHEHARSERGPLSKGARAVREHAVEPIARMRRGDAEQDAATIAEPMAQLGKTDAHVGKGACVAGGPDEFVMTMDICLTDAGRSV